MYMFVVFLLNFLYGLFQSLKKLKSMLADAEKANKQIRKGQHKSESRPAPPRQGFRKPDNSDSDGDERIHRKKSFRKPSDSDDNEEIVKKRRQSRSRSGDRYKSGRRREKSRSRSNSRDRYRHRRSRSRERQRSHRSRERYRRSRSNSRNRNGRSRSRDQSKKRFMRPGDSDEDVRTTHERPRSKFMKPSGSDDSFEASNSSERHSRYSTDKNSARENPRVPSWRKKEFMKPKEDGEDLSKKSRDRRPGKQGQHSSGMY